jgi:breast cancer 2 susceptibility protein
MSKLTSDGGLISVMDLIVLKVYPVGFLEFIEENGVTRKKGPWDEKEEARIWARWMVSQEMRA